jgi:hypothetical protein
MKDGLVDRGPRAIHRLATPRCPPTNRRKTARRLSLTEFVERGLPSRQSDRHWNAYAAFAMSGHWESTQSAAVRHKRSGGLLKPLSENLAPPST